MGDLLLNFGWLGLLGHHDWLAVLFGLLADRFVFGFFHLFMLLKLVLGLVLRNMLRFVFHLVFWLVFRLMFKLMLLLVLFVLLVLRFVGHQFVLWLFGH